jgi:hypothetical protein
MKHIIQKQVLQITLGPRVEAFSAQHAASHFYREVLVPLLERAFDELAGEGDILRFDRLVLDLGTIGESHLHKHIQGQELYLLLKAQLQRIINKEGAVEGLERMPRRKGVLEQWWYYMEKGRLPWNADSVESDWQQLVLESLSVDYEAVTRLRAAFEKQPGFRRRVGSQHRDDFLETLAGILTGLRQESMRRWVEECCVTARWFEKAYRAGSKVIRSPQGIKRREKGMLARSLRRWADEHKLFLSQSGTQRKAIVWELVLMECALRPEKMKGDGPLALLAEWLTKDRALRVLLKKAGPDSSLVRYFGDSVAPTLSPDPAAGMADVASGEAPGVFGRGGGMPQTGGVAAADGATNDKKTSGKEVAAAAAGSEEEQVFDKRQVEEEGLFGKYAGLILLHPFLGTLFAHCGLFEEGRFVAVEARRQAIFLLYYLATGQKEGPEYELLFPKLFCGYGLEEPLPVMTDLADGCYAEADALLEMVPQRWDKMKNVSAGALREGFLQRGGKMVNRRDRLVLVMEASAIDVLLDYLPWNLTIVKFPWLKELLYVEWR